MSVSVAKKPLIMSELANKYKSTTAGNKTATASNTSSTGLKSTAAANMTTMKRAAAFTSGMNKNNSIYPSSPFVGAKINPSASDMKFENVVHVDSGNYMPTKRSLDRMFNKWSDSQNVQAGKFQSCNQSNGLSLADIATAAATVSKTIQSIKPAAVESKASIVSDYAGETVNKTVSTDVNNVLSGLASAKTSKDVKTGLATVGGQISAKTTLSQGLAAQIDTDTASKTKAEGELGTINQEISSTKQQISSLGIQITSLESKISIAKGLNQDTSALQSQLDGLKKEKETAEAKLKQLDGPQGSRETKETEISNLSQAIKDNTASKEKTDSEIKELQNAETKYSAQQTKLEQSEQKEMQKLFGKLDGIAKKLVKEKDESKKQKLIEEYKGIAPKYNTLIENTSAKHNLQKVSDEPQI